MRQGVSARRFLRPQIGDARAAFSVSLIGDLPPEQHNPIHIDCLLGALVKIFLVEDNAGFRATLSGLIERIPSASLVGWADDAPEAVSAIHKLQPDVLLVDLMLTSTSGFQVLRSVRRASLGVACLVVTNMVSPGLRALCMTLGAQGVFDKTLELDSLALALTKLASNDVALTAHNSSTATSLHP